MAVDCLAGEWMRYVREWLQQHDFSKKNSGVGGLTYTDLLNLLQDGPPAPPSLCATWEKRVWNLQDEPLALYYLRCLASSFENVYSFSECAFLINATSSSPFPRLPHGSDIHGVLHRRPIRVVALRLLPTTTDIVQLGWRGTDFVSSSTERLQPALCSRTHFVIQLLDSMRHFSAWAYGDVGTQMRLGDVLCAVMYASSMDDGSTAYVIHNTERCSDVEWVMRPMLATAEVTRDPLSLVSATPPLTFKQLTRAFAPEIAGQELCKSMLLLVATHTIYRSLRCRSRRPLHLLLLGPSRSGKSALLRAFLHFLGSCATLVGAHVMRGGQRSTVASQAITAAYPHVHQQLLMAGAVSAVDSLVIDELPANGSGAFTNHVGGLLCGLCPVNSGGGSGTGGAATLRGGVVRTRAQITAASNDDNLGIAAIVPQFTLVARTTANLLLQNAALVGDEVIAASVARSQSKSAPRSRSTSLGSSRVSMCHGPLSSATLHIIVKEAPCAASLEAAIPVNEFTAFYLSRLSEWCQYGVTECEKTFGSHLVVLWELNIARLILNGICNVEAEAQSGDCRRTCVAGWNETLAEEVWLCYKHHLWTADTAASASSTILQPAVSVATTSAGLSSLDHFVSEGPVYGPASRSAAGAHKRKRVGKKAACLALLRQMLAEQRACNGSAVPEEVVRCLFERMGGEHHIGMCLSSVIQQLLDAGLIIRRLNAYAVVAEV
ncbi:hypothetical protein DPX39_100079900 [Trypanosoma brucei equiperdum]|uniref:Uncharacterized protein n=1 Tax=Trypanosoma brucei equiperdum TaxID=630700 RepID=A0A3L6L3N9_9TRYP|nr:hypothetical protein DPX39_100079900 [Trypanosoma brucei equiperdum]